MKCTDCFTGHYFSVYYLTFAHKSRIDVLIDLFCLDFIVFIVVVYKYDILLNNLPEKMMRKDCLKVPILAFSGYFIPLGAFCVLSDKTHLLSERRLNNGRYLYLNLTVS